VRSEGAAVEIDAAAQRVRLNDRAARPDDRLCVGLRSGYRRALREAREDFAAFALRVYERTAARNADGDVAVFRLEARDARNERAVVVRDAAVHAACDDLPR